MTMRLNPKSRCRANRAVFGFPVPVMLTGGCGVWKGRGQTFTDMYCEYLPFHANGSRVGPCPQDERQVLVVPCAGFDGGDARIDIGVVRQPDGESCHQSSCGQVVQPGQLFGDPQWLARLSQAAADNIDSRVQVFGADLMGQGGRAEIGVRVHVVGTLAVLGQSHRVEAGAGGMHRLIESRANVGVHEPSALLRRNREWL